MITIRPINPRVPAQFLDLAGQYYLSTSSGTELRVTKTIDRVDQLGRITQEAALSLTLPATKRNAVFFAQYEPDVLQRKTPKFEVEVMNKGERQPLTGCKLISRTAEGYEVELFGDDWLDDLEGVALNDLNLGLFTWDRATILSTWGTGRTEPFALPGLASYGGWYDPGQVSLRDLRIWWNLGQLLRSVFCAVGWSFVSPHFDDGDGRYWYGYLSGLRWHTYRTKKDPQYLEVTTSAQSVDGQITDRPTWSVVEDAEGRWQTFSRETFPTFIYRHQPGPNDEPVLVTIEVDFTVTLPPGPGAETPNFYFAILRYNHRSITPIEVYRETYAGGALLPRTLTINTSHYVEATVPQYINRQTGEPVDTYLPRFEVVFGYETSAGPVAFTIDNATTRYRPDPRYYVEGDDIYLGDLLDGEISGKDLIEAIAHLINGKVVTDYGKREVTLFAATDYKRTEDGQTVQGFELSETVDYIAKTVPDSREWIDEQDERARFVVYDFADGDDALIEEIGRDRFRRRVDLGRGTNDTTEYKNPLFGPTIGVNVPSEVVAGTGIFLPALWDNADGLVSHQPGPRIATWYGQLEQSDDEGNVNIWRFDNTQQETVPVLLMLPDAGIGIDNTAEPITFSGFATDLYNRHYLPEKIGDQVQVSVLLSGGDVTYNNVNFRRALIVQGETGPYELKPVAVRDHPRGQDVAVLVEGKVKKC